MEAPPKLPPAPGPVPPQRPPRTSRLDRIFLAVGLIGAVAFVLFAFFSPTSSLISNPLTTAAEKVRLASQDKAVLNNARQLAAAADQHYLESGVAFARYSQIVGPTNYVKTLSAIAGETYPSHYTQGVTITITGVAGARTITYAP
jgi:type IV pilus assembly protein PilA